MSSRSEVTVSLDFTPNPNTLKYSVNRELLPKGNAHFSKKDDAARRSPLAAKLLDVPGVCNVMIGKDFVTVSKTDSGDWDVVHKGSSTAIHQHLSSGLPILNEGAELVPPISSSELTIVEQKIREILDQEIRPAIAMDGGDVAFEKFENGVVYVHLQGACAGCPGATMTLKMGIEARLREAIPEVLEVVSV